jgi:hypothetical protein
LQGGEHIAGASDRVGFVTFLLEQQTQRFQNHALIIGQQDAWPFADSHGAAVRLHNNLARPPTERALPMPMVKG